MVRKTLGQVIESSIIGTMVVLGLGVSSTSCTRSVNKNAIIQLALPSGLSSSGKVSSQATLGLRHFIANISGPGISPVIFYSWDSHDGRIPVPSSFAVNVPSGDNRLIQVIGVFEDSAVGSTEQIYYGDAIAAITQDINVTVALGLINSTPGEGRIAGKWLDASGVGPTGKITMKYTPAGKPSMIVHHTEIFDGFFSVFALQGMNFEYVLSGGVNMFGVSGTAINIDSSVLNTATTAKIYVPALYKQRGSSPYTYELQDQTNVVVGWFGDGLSISGKKVCYPNNSTPPSYLSYSYSDSVGLYPVAWDYTTSPFTSTVAHPLTLGANVVGGYPSSDSIESLCKDGITLNVRNVDYLSVDSAALGDHDRILAFRGPYVAKYNLFNPSHRDAFKVDYTPYATSLTMSWEYLPGVISSGVSGSDIFLRISATAPTGGGGDEYRADDGINCAGLGSYGFSLWQSTLAVSGTNSAVVTKTLNAPVDFDSAYSAGRVTLILCPFANTATGKSYFQSGVDYHPYSGL